MKLQLTNSEARQIVSDKFNVFAHEVEIEPKPSTAIPNYSPVLEGGVGCSAVRHALCTLFIEGRYWGSNPNKIALIKAVRSLTDCSLKEGKDFVEEVLLNEKSF